MVLNRPRCTMHDGHGPRHVTPAGRCVFYDLFPKAGADELLMRSTLLRGLAKLLRERGVMQTQAATLGITQARVSDISVARLAHPIS